MITLDRDVIAKLAERDQQVIDHVQRYSGEELTVPALVAWETFKSQQTRSQMLRAQSKLRTEFDRIIDFSDDVALEAAYLDEKLQSQGVDLDTVDLLNLASAHEAGGTFITHNKRDFDNAPLHELVDIDVVHTD